MKALRPAIALLALLLSASTCTCRRAADEPPRPPGTRTEEKIEVVQWIYDGKLQNGWNDWGWTGHAAKDGNGPAQVNFANYGGWIVGHQGPLPMFGALTFRIRAPREYGEFLEVRVESNNQNVYPRIIVKPTHRRDLPDDWTEVVIPMRELNPEHLPWDRIIFRAATPVGPASISIDKIGLTKADAADLAAPSVGPARDVVLTVDCKAKPVPINPMIYSIAFDPQHDAKDSQQFELGAVARRWGGNPSSRYNWQLGNAWNTAFDWFYENVNYTPNPNYSYKLFFADNDKHAMKTVLTVPIMGWVAKDTTSVSFPKSKYPQQQAFDDYRPEAGNGVGADGQPLTPPPPSQTSVEAKPEFIKKWIEAIRTDDVSTGKRSVSMYILDNEPALWDSTHRDVHPEPLSYDELLDRTIAYGTAVREADPDAVIAGPAEWGWPAYFFSAKDAKAGFALKPDRLAHGDVPLMAWYLSKLKKHEQKTGVRILDVVDVHFYPQAKGIYGSNGGVDKETSALRIRSTRGLWDPSYVDESYIAEPVMLIPRLKKWIDENYPGRGMSIGEWSFGGEMHMSGALATAEALGRFGQLGLASAFYWTYPPKNSPVFWAFRAYRNFDGKGGRFLDGSLPTVAEKDTSIFASVDASGTHLVVLALNFAPDHPIHPKIVLGGCSDVKSSDVYELSGDGSAGLAPKKAEAHGSELELSAVAPYSISVLDIRLQSKP